MLKDNCNDNALWGDACLAPLPLTHYAFIRCMQATQKQHGATPPARTTSDRPKTDQEEKPQNQPRSRRGWVRIRDIRHPRIHSPPQPRPSAKSPWPFSGIIGPFYSNDGALSGICCRFSMLRLHPLAGMHSIFGGCTFASAFCPFRVLMLLVLGGIFYASVACPELTDSNSIS